MNAAQHAGYLGAGGRAGETSLFFLFSSPALRSVSGFYKTCILKPS